MQSDKEYHQFANFGLPFEEQVGFNYLHGNPLGATADSFLTPTQFSRPVHGIELQPSANCPRNFIVFDQTSERSKVIYPPLIAPNFTQSGFNLHSNSASDGDNWIMANGMNLVGKEASSSFEEDANDIDALLSLDCNDDEEESEEGEEVSTARTNRYDGCSSPDSFCNYSRLKMGKTAESSHFLEKKNGCGSGNSGCCERKKKKMKNMVSLLRGIVPGSRRMNTVDVLDEAVRYLKSLKVEVKKNGVDDLGSNNYD